MIRYNSIVKRLRTRDWRFYLLVLVHIICIIGFVSEGRHVTPAATGGWRTVDLEELKSRIGSGDLSDREADFYHVLPESGRAEAPR